jgi:PrtD family type I secretion system ABC transporter
MDVFHQSPPITSSQVHQRENILGDMWRQSYLGLIAIGVFTVLFNILRLATAIYALNVLDRVVSSRSLETLIMLTAIVLVAVLVATLLNILRRVMLLRWGSWIERNIGPRMFAMGIGSDLPSPSGLLRDVARVRNFVGGTGLVSWIDVMFAPLFFAGVFIISPAMGTIVVIASLLVLILGIANELVTRQSRIGALTAGSEKDDWISSAERNKETVGSLSMGSNFADLWFRSASERLDESDRTRRINVYFIGATRFVRRCLRIAILGFGVWLVIEGNLTIGAVIASYYVGRIGFSLLQQAMQKWRDMINARQSYVRIRSALENHEPVSVSISRSELPVPLVFDHVSVRYPKQFTSTFRNVNVAVAPGEALYVIGPSAVGKTTFARLATGVMEPKSGQATSGQVRLGDITVHRLVQGGQGEQIGYLPQHIQLFNGTIRENIARMTSGDMKLVIEAAKLAGIHDIIVRLPHGYDTVISEDEPLLSTGRKKSVALARAFYGWPSLIVLDEPEPHLDRQQRSALNAAIRSLKAQGTIVVVTTQMRPPLRNIATKVLLLQPGKTMLIEDADEIAALRRPKSLSSPASD